MYPGYRQAFNFWNTARTEAFRSQQSYAVKKDVTVPRAATGTPSASLKKGDSVVYIGKVRGPVPTNNRFVHKRDGQTVGEFDVPDDKLGRMRDYIGA